MDAAAQALSILFEYSGGGSSSDLTGDTTNDSSHAVAQLPLEVIEQLSLETVTSCDLVATIVKLVSSGIVLRVVDKAVMYEQKAGSQLLCTVYWSYCI